MKIDKEDFDLSLARNVHYPVDPFSTNVFQSFMLLSDGSYKTD